MADRPDSRDWNRRGFLGLGALSALASWGFARTVSAHNLPPGQYGGPAYDKALGVKEGYRAVFQSPNIESSTLIDNQLEHLLPLQVKNWLNGFQFPYKTRPEDLHVVVATYASANLLTYADPIWQKYRLGEKYNVIDSATGAPAVRNLFWPSRVSAGASTDPDNPKGIYHDAGIEALQKRGVLFLT
jgi:hypothetical protein